MDHALDESQLAELLDIAVDAAHSASELILSGFRSPRLTAERKADGSPVTPFDREAELAIRTFIERHQPHDWPVFGEEFGGETAGARYRWVVDPIDGTLGYSRGLPNFGTLLALEDVVSRRSLVGVIHLPAMRETYRAARGAGAWFEGERLSVAPQRDVHDYLVSAPPLQQLEIAGSREGAGRLRAQIPHLRCFADCWAHAMVARGALDALAEFSLARWDIAASEVIVEEAGGRALVRDSRLVTGKYDLIIGSPHAAGTIAELVDFR